MNISLLKSKTILTKTIQANHVTQRAMHRATNTIYHHGTPLLLNTPKIRNNMSTYTSNKFKKNTIPNLVNDDTGNHTHVAVESCVQSDCETKICKILCDVPKKFEIKGHNTHKPPIGRFCRFVAETDTNGNTNAQYFVPTNQKKTITAAEKTSYGNDIKANTKQQPFIDQHIDKYE